MGFFDFRKKRDVLDLTERYKRQQAKAAEISSDTGASEIVPSTSSDTGSAFGFLGGLASAGSDSATETSSDSGDYVDVSSSPTTTNEKRKKLVKRIMDMTNKIEDLSNQIYHLQQRIEVLERKSGVGIH